MWARRAQARRRLSTLRAARIAPCALRSVLWVPTEKQAPSDAAVPSHQLLLRAGFVRKSGHGLFALLPLGCRVVAKIEALIDSEMNKIGGNRVDVPILMPNELWKQSGRWQSRGPELMTLKDRRDEQLVLGPTHEESITSLVATHYKAVEANASLRLYQIGRKFRDETRPRFGLLRAREFVMKDMYSFDTSYDNALKTYQDVTAAYKEILMSRLQLPVKCVEADSGNIGGDLSHEFHVLADVGEDSILSCSSKECDYAANVDKAEGRLPALSEPLKEPSHEFPLKLRDTIAQLEEKNRAKEPNVWMALMELLKTAGSHGLTFKLIQEQEQGRDLEASGNGTKKINSKPRVALCFARSDREVNSLAVKPFFGGNEGKVIEDEAKMAKLLLNRDSMSKLYLLLDESLLHDAHSSVVIKTLCATVESLSKDQKHTHVVWGTYRLAKAGDRCPRCNGGVLEAKRGIEVGHVFYLGQKYSKMIHATYTDIKNKKHPFEMGCFGLGVSRLVAAAVEASHDEHGIVWPLEIAPYKVIVMSIGGKSLDDPLFQIAWDIADELASGKVPGFVKDDVLLDDRTRESPGSKLTESELIGFPYRVVVGKRYTKEGLVEIQIRATMERIYRKPDEVVAFFAGK